MNNKQEGYKETRGMIYQKKMSIEETKIRVFLMLSNNVDYL
jgi:hypothetical protein